MKEMSHQYELQSYFKSRCNSFYIAYRQMKRWKKESEEIDFLDKTEEIEFITTLLEMEEGELQNRYVQSKYSKEELQKKKEQLEQLQEEHDKTYDEYEKNYREWRDRMSVSDREIERIVGEIAEYEGFIMLTTEAEIYALISVYWENPVKEYDIINFEEQYQETPFSEKSIYKEFYDAYQTDLKATSFTASDDRAAMRELYKKYF